MSENKEVEKNEKQSSFFIIPPIVLLLVAGGAFTWFMVDKASFKNVASFGFVKGNQTELVDESDSHIIEEENDSEEESDNHDWADSHHEEEHESVAHNEEDHNWDAEHNEELMDSHEESHDVVEINHHEETSHHIAEAENGAYHIIAGAFEIEDNANAFAQNVKNAKIIHGNRYHMVAVGSYNSEEDATNAIMNLQSEHGSGLWIFKN